MELKIIENVKDEPTLKSAQDFVGGYRCWSRYPNKKISPKDLG
jgi:hypothetical protein